MTSLLIIEDYSGFTLIELLVAITLLGFLSVALVGGLKFGSRSWQKSQNSSLSADDVRAAQQALTRDLNRLYPTVVVAGTDDAYVDFDGAPNRMDFISGAQGRSGEMRHVILDTVQDGPNMALRYSEKGELSRPGIAPNRKMLLSHLATLQLAYFGIARQAQSPGWTDTWRHQAALPLLIRVRIAFSSPSTARWPELILAPRIAADAGCNFDALTKFCQGRS